MDQLSSFKYRIAPNPFNDECHVLFDQVQTEVDVQIFTINGQFVKQSNFKNTDRLQIKDITENGIYILEMICVDQKKIRKLISKAIKK